MTEHPSEGEKSQRGPQPSVNKPSQTSPSCTFVLYVITEIPAMERISLNGHCTYTRRARRVSLKSLKNNRMKRQKREMEGRSHLTKEKLGPRDNKFNITEEACFRGRSLRPRTVPSPRQCPDTGNTGCLWVSFSREEVGSWDRLRKKVHLALSRKQRKQEFSLLLMKDTTSSKSSKANTLTEKSQSPIIERLDRINCSHRLLLNPCCAILIWDKSSFLSQFLPT